MKKKTNNPDFEYEISCDQMCGKGHFSMRGIIKVVSQSEFILWRAKQKSNYAMVFPEKDQNIPPKTDSAKQVTTGIKAGAAEKTVAKNQ
jgi:cytochrome c oxidase subunit 2